MTVEEVLAELKEHYGEWFLRECTNRGDKGIMVQSRSGEVFILSVQQVRGVTIP